MQLRETEQARVGEGAIPSRHTGEPEMAGSFVRNWAGLHQTEAIC